MLTSRRFACLCLLLFSFTFVVAQTDIAKVRTNYLGSYYFTYAYTGALKAIPMSLIMTRIGADGSFNRSNKAPTQADLTDTLFKMVYAFERPDSTAWYKDSAVRAKLYAALDYWLDHYPSFVWTGSALTQPNSLGMILAKLYNNFQTDTAYAATITDIKKQALRFLRYTWSNGVTATTFNSPNLGNNPSSTYDWQRMGNLGYRIFGYTGVAAACDDSAMMDTLSIMMSNQFPLQINKPNSPVVAATYDGTIFEHGAQYYNTGYGSDWIRFVSRYFLWVKNSKWAMTNAQQQSWGNVLLDGMQWMAYKTHAGHNIIGRYSGRSGPAGTQLPPMIPEFTSEVDSSVPQRAAVLRLQGILATSGNTIDSTKYFWDSHIILNHSANYFASIRMLSSRAVGAESSDASGGTGLQNFYVSDGSTMLYRRGTEYDNARVGWNWRCIPGGTIKQKTGTLPLIPWSAGTESDNSIAGGVSDGNVSIGVFNLSRTNTYAKTKVFKSYFAFKDILICAGNSITDADAAAGDIYTTLNQTERLTDASYSVNGGAVQTVTAGTNQNSTFDITSPSWFWQDSTGYIVLPRSGVATRLLLSAETRSGNWYNLDHANTNATVSVNVFQLSINHGSPANGWLDTTYRYVVVPSVSVAGLVDFFNNRILAKNDNSLYLEYNNKNILSASYNGYTGLFFTGAGYNKATGLGPDSLNVSTSNYAAVLLKRRSGGLDIRVSDLRNGFYTSTPVNLRVNRIYKSNSFTPPRAYGPVTITPTLDSTLITLDLSKTNSIYYGEPVTIAADTVHLSIDSTTTTADAFVNGGSNAGTNYGFNSYLLATNGGASPAYTRYTYVKFDLHGLATSDLLNAKLRLHNGSAVTTEWKAFRVTDNNWTEGGITWNNRPAYDSLHVLDSVGGSMPAGYLYFDITSAAKGVGSDSILSLIVLTPLTQSYIYSGFSSRQCGIPAWYPAIITTSQQTTTSSSSVARNSLGIQGELPPAAGDVSTGILLYPNPARSTVDCWFSSALDNQRYTILVTDGRGAALGRQTGVAAKGKNKLQLDLRKYASGVYTVTLFQQGQVRTTKLVKQ